MTAPALSDRAEAPREAALFLRVRPGPGKIREICIKSFKLNLQLKIMTKPKEISFVALGKKVIKK